jgi:hypothetical protein
MNRIAEVNQKVDFLQKDLNIEDALLISLAPDNKKVDTKDMLKAARAGKLNEYVQTTSPLVQRYIDQDENGFPIVIRPNKYNLDKEYDKLVASLGGNYVDQQLAAFNKIKLTKKVPAEVLRERAEAFVLNNEEASVGLDWNPEFQKLFKEEYNNNLEREDEAKVNFVYNNLTKYNDPKYQMTSQSKDGNTFKITGNGFSIGSYNFSVRPRTTLDLAESLNKTRIGSELIELEAVISLFGDSEVSEVVMPENATGTFILSDPNLGKGVAKGKPMSLIESNGKAFLVYYNNDKDRQQVVTMTPTILSQMATYYKTETDNFIEAYMSKGVDLRRYASSGNIKTSKGGGSPAPTPPNPNKEKVKKAKFTGKASNSLISVLGGDTTNINR